MDRRKFLLGGSALGTLTWCSVPDLRGRDIPSLQDDVQDAARRAVDSAETDPDIETMRINLQKNHPDDMRLARQLLCAWNCGDMDFLDAIKLFQSWRGLINDWDIWPWTLQALYLGLFQHSGEINQLQAKRLEVYSEMIPYPSKTRRVNHLDRTVTLSPSSQPRVFSNAYYYWETSWFPRDWINQELLFELNYVIERQDLVTYMMQINGKFVLAAYHFGQLIFASYTSPGNPNHNDGHGESTPTWSWLWQRSNQYADEHWITWAESSVRLQWERFVSDIMPYAVNITWGIFSHAGPTNWLRRSHGCMRLPLYYAKCLHEIFETNGRQMSWEILEA
jgi:hypothetical protein